MQARIKDIVIAIIVFASIGVAFNILFGENTMIYLHSEQLGSTNLTWYKLDFLSYVNNLKTNITDVSLLVFDTPTREWLRNPSGLEEFWNQLANNLAVILDYIILILNVLLYPLRLGGYMLRFLVALLGLNTTSSSSLEWLGTFLNNVIGLAIPYI